MQLDLRGRGLFILRYEAPAELAPDRNGDVVAAIEQVAPTPIGIVFVVPAGAGRIDAAVPSFWHGVTRRLPVRAMAIVAPEVMVRIAARAFGVTTALEGRTLDVQAFRSEELEGAVAWVSERLAAAP